MKKFGLSVLIAVMVLGLSVFLAACGGGGGGGNGGGGGTITNNTQGTQAASSSVQGGSMAQGTTETFHNLSNIGLSSIGAGVPQLKTSAALAPSPAMKRVIRMSEKFARSQAANAAAASMKKASGAFKSRIMSATTVTTGSWACLDAGTASWDLTYDDVANTFTGNITFANCRESDTQMDGVYHLAASATANNASLTITLGPTGSGDFTVLDYASNYSTLIAKTTMSGFTLGVAVSGGTNTITEVMSAAGAMNFHDFFTLDDFTITFANYSDTYSADLGTMAFSITSNGSFTETWNSQSVSASFASFKIDLTEDSANSADLMSLSGTFSISFTPANCFNGTFTFVTNTPITMPWSTGEPIAGEIVINGTTTLTFNPNGTITVTTGTESHTYNSMYELTQVCPIATLDESTPVSSGSTGTASANATMTITLGWVGPGGASNADMDLHLNFYSEQTPTAATPGTWYVDWHVGSTCTNPAGVDLGTDAVDVDNDGICDVGLDYDNTVGYGPEHITATKLPAGYYVVSVDSYGLYDASEDVTVTIQIGGSVFGPFTHTFTTSDSETGGVANAASWFAVADMVVDNSGNVTVQAHNPSLELWHDGAFGMLTPALRAKGL